MKMYGRGISKLGSDPYEDRLQTVYANGDDAQRWQVNGCAGKTAGIAWMPDEAFVTGNIQK